MLNSLSCSIHQIIIVLTIFTTNGKDVLLSFNRMELYT